MLNQTGNSPQNNQVPSQDQGARNEKGGQQNTDDALALRPSNIDRRTALQAMVAGMSALAVNGAKVEAENSPNKTPQGDRTETLGGMALEYKNGLSPEALQRNFGASFIEKDGKTYLQHSGKATPNPIEIGADTLSIQCSLKDENLQIRLIDKPDARGQHYAQFATIDKLGEFTVGSSQVMFNATNKLYPARSLQITHQEHPELHAALKDMAAKGYSFEHALSAKSSDFYVLRDQVGKVIARFEHNLFKQGGIDESMKQWVRSIKALDL